MEEEKKISICGDNCAACPRYIATHNNDDNQLHEYAQMQLNLGIVDKLPDIQDLKCHGCRTNQHCTYGLNQCQHAQNIHNCGECTSYPCSGINSVFTKTDELKPVFKNKLSEQKYKQIEQAFLLKRETLNEINKKFFNRIKTKHQD